MGYGILRTFTDTEKIINLKFSS